MAKPLGKAFRLLMEDPDNAGAYLIIANMRSNSKNKANDKIDVTDKDGMPWTELLEGGVQSMEVSGAGVFSDAATVAQLEKWADAGNIKNFRVLDGLGNMKTGPFFVASFEHTGEHNKEQTYSIKLSSAGTIVPVYVS